MDYVIKNDNVFIKLNENGCPVTCSESQKGLFEYSKAMNICASLPKTLKKMNFKVEAVPDIPPKERENVIVSTYIPPENISKWLDKFGQCADILNEARQRREDLNKELSDTDKKLEDLMHEIEFSEKVDMYHAWIKINEIKNVRKKRRNIKDEMLIIQSVFSNGITYLKRDNIQKSIDGLSKRKYTLRIVEEDEEDAAM